MRFDEITGKCPICGQNPSGMTTMHEGGKDTTHVKCSNGHWSMLEQWMPAPAPKLEPEVAKASIPGMPRETSTMLQNPEEAPDPLRPVEATIKVTPHPEALLLLRADWNPDKNLDIGRLKLIAAALITEAIHLR